MRPTWRTRSLAFAAACLSSACGGGAALLHPAHALAESRVTAGAGVSGQFVFGGGERAITSGRRTPVAGGSPDGEAAFFEGAVANATFSPGIAPWVGARAGLGGHNEAGLTYTGRTARIDARHAFGDDSIALSVGAGVSAVLLHPGTQTPLASSPAVSAGRFAGTPDEFSATGFGVDVPVLVGWRSTASIVSAWAGARAGWERILGQAPLVTPAGEDGGSADVRANRLWAGGLLGMALGVDPFWVALEVDVAYQRVTATASFPDSVEPSARDANLAGLTLAPAGAIVGKF